MIGNIFDNTTELYMIKYTFGEMFSSRGATLYKNPSDQTVCSYWLNVRHTIGNGGHSHTASRGHHEYLEVVDNQ